MNELIMQNENIENMIYEIRGKQVMLDSDLAKLYGVETKRINEAVKNNPDKFPERFSWKLTEYESKNFLVENFDQKKLEMRGGRFKNPRVFTEQGVAMLTTILKSKTATEVSIKIMDAFVAMRHFIIDNKDIYKSINNINNKLIEHDEKLNLIFSKFEEKKITNEIYFEGQIYDAYSKILDILSMAKSKIVIIDAYADKSVLDIISKLNVEVILICKSKGLIKRIDIDKYNKQYNNLKVIYNDSFHDRYFILDNELVYHCGTSINHAGSKTFSINYLTDKLVKEKLIDYLSKAVT